MTNPLVWHCCRQRAGPLVKECRAIRPNFRRDESSADRRAKAELRQHQRNAVNRRLVGRMELWLAVLGRDGIFYTLTYDDEHLPPDYAAIRRDLRAFIARVARWRQTSAFAYAYRIEGLHGDNRYHLHFVCRYSDLTPAEVRKLWRAGEVDDEPVLLTRPVRDPETGTWYKVSDGGYLRLAEYMCKERIDGDVVPMGKRPWGTSRALRSLLPPPEVWMDSSGVVEVPAGVLWARRGGTQNDFGAYYYGRWIEADTP